MGTTTSNPYTVDTLGPTATIVVADSRLGIGETGQVTATFSEPVHGFTSVDLSVTNGTISPLSASDRITCTATFTPTAGLPVSWNVIWLGPGAVADDAGNLQSGTTTSNLFTIDTIRPTATIVVDDIVLTSGETTVTITFSEPVTGLTLSAFTATHGVLSALASLDGGQTWTATLTPVADVLADDVTVRLTMTGVRDLAGNPGLTSTSSVPFAVRTVVTPAPSPTADGPGADSSVVGVTRDSLAATGTEALTLRWAAVVLVGAGIALRRRAGRA